MNARLNGFLAATFLLSADPAQAMLFERADIHPGQVVLGVGANSGGGLLVGASVGVTSWLSLGVVGFQNFGPSVAGTVKLGETPFGLTYGVTLGYVTIGQETPNPTTGLNHGRYAGMALPFAARLGGPESPFMVRADLMRVFYPLEGGSPEAEWMNTEIAYRWGALELKTGTRSPIGIRLVF